MSDLFDYQPTAKELARQGMEQAAEHASTHGAPRVWVERGGSPAPVAVTTGLTNGDVTEIEPGPLASGARVIVDMVRAERQRTDNGPRPPFG